MPGVSPSVQRTIMHQLADRRLQTSDIWEYAVASAWLQHWRTTVKKSQQFDSLKSTPSQTESMPKSAEGFSFVSVGDFDVRSESRNPCARPVTMSVNDNDNSYISETEWNIFISWFGLDKDHQLRRRPMFSLYMSLDRAWLPYGVHVLCDNELDFLPIWVATLNDLVEDKQNQTVNVFAWESMEYIGKQIRRVLGVKTNMKVRLWLSIQEENHAVVLEPVLNGHQSLISKVTEVIPEVRAVMERRQCQINRKYCMPGKDTSNIDIRRPLSEEWYGNRILSISIGVEGLGIDMPKTDEDIGQLGSAQDDDFDSIVTLSSIKNEWDDVLATYVDKYTEDMTVKTANMKEELMRSAREIVGEKLDEIVEIRADYEMRFTALKERETVCREAERKLNEQEEDLKKRLNIYKTGLADLQRGKQKMAEDLQRLESQNMISESKVTLNVGGHSYTTSVITLTNEKDSLLALMFSAQNSMQREQDGSYFIDRDGTNFRYILNYLRDGGSAIEALPLEPKLVKELIIEASYYSLPQMVAFLQEKMALITQTGRQQGRDGQQYQSF